MRKFCLLFILVVPIWVSALDIVLQHTKSEKEFYKSGEECNFFWKVVNEQGIPVTTQKLKKDYKYFVLTITQNGKSLEIYKIPLGVLSYNWKIPATKDSTKYTVHLDATPKSLSKRRLSAITAVQVQKKKQYQLPEDLDSSIRVLMDWNGKRGYYESCSPIQALKVVQHACKFIRDHADSSEYQDYLQVMQKAENTQLKKLRVYCPVRRARVRVDNWYMGALKEFDSSRQMYYLEINLPADYGRAYKIQLDRGNKTRELLHTHTGTGECVVDDLYELASFTIQSSLPARVKTANGSYSNLGNSHKLQMYKLRVQTLWIKVENGPTLKIFINPKKNTLLKLKKRNNSFVLYKNGVRYNFVGNQINLTEF